MRYSKAMCYSALVEADYRNYLRLTGAEMDLDQFLEIFSARVEDRSIRIPRALDRAFDSPRNDRERAMRAAIQAWRANEATRLEKELFTQRKRLADAERKLAAKATQAAQESRRIASNKITQALAKLPLLSGSTPHPNDARIFPMSHAPLVVRDGPRNVVRLARYHCRPAGQPADVDRRFPGLYNARRDNLARFWRAQFGHTHGLMLVHTFFENVERDGANQVLQFVPRPPGVMYVACLYSRWRAPDGQELLSFAAITDEPPDEVRAAGHDRIIVNLAPSNVDRWLTPEGRSEDELQQILTERQQPYYEHRIAA
jgi:putative SOS response-associated peptidase YedK